MNTITWEKPQVKVQSSVMPTEQISLEEWFTEFNVSKSVVPKPIPLERHVFRMNKFVAMTKPKPKKFTFKTIYSIFVKNKGYEVSFNKGR